VKLQSLEFIVTHVNPSFIYFKNKKAGAVTQLPDKRYGLYGAAFSPKARTGHADAPGHITCPGVQHSPTAEITAQQFFKQRRHIPHLFYHFLKPT